MDYMELLVQIFEVCIIPLLGVLTTFFIKFLNAKCAELSNQTSNEIAKKYLKMINDTIVTCVIATNQTYTDSLKQQGKFDADAQKIAFEKTLTAVKSILSDDAKQYIIETTGDLNAYLTQLIEAEVKKNKSIIK